MNVEVVRGTLVESVHHVAMCVVDASGRILYADGDVDAPVFLRSAAKPFIAAAAIAVGVRERFDLEQREIAVMAASHFGQPFHIAAVRSILEKIGMQESDLQCGTHLPYDEASAQALIRSGTAPSASYNNCSGKHAGILALCKAIGADSSGYLRPAHPAQRAILALCARVSDEDPQAWPVAVDGCGIPVYATGLRNAALSFARLAHPAVVRDEADARALQIVRDAMIAYPEYVAGTGQFDSELMRVGGGSIACKAGAEGVHGTAAVGSRLGAAVKVRDGASRARGPAVVAMLGHLGVLDERQATELARFGRPIVYNRAGLPVGEIRAILEGNDVAVAKASRERV